MAIHTYIHTYQKQIQSLDVQCIFGLRGQDYSNMIIERIKFSVVIAMKNTPENIEVHTCMEAGVKYLQH